MICKLSKQLTAGIFSAFLMIIVGSCAFAAETSRPHLQNIQKVLIMGNSLTQHGPSTEKLGWSHRWGMAATTEENDYVHQLYKRICAVQEPQGRKPGLKVKALLLTHIYTPPEALSYAADYIVLQMGDNLVPQKATQETMVEPYVKLVHDLKQAQPTAMVFVTSLWGGIAPGDQRNDLIQQVCKQTGATFVDLRPIAADKLNRASSEGVYNHPGVAWHPGDRGMKAIAEAIWQKTKEAYSYNPQSASKSPETTPAAIAPSIIPQPQQTHWTGKSTFIRQWIQIRTNAASSPAIKLLKLHLQNLDGIKFTINAPAPDSPASYILEINKNTTFTNNPNSNAQSYNLDFSSDQATLQSSTDAGLFYGVQTFAQCLTQSTGRWQLPIGQIKDWPSLERRGVFLSLRSVKASPQSIAKLKNLIDALAGFKVNYLMLEVADNMRYDKEKFPEREATAFTKDQVRELVNYAKSRQMQVVPSLQALSHVQWIMSNPQNIRLLEDPTLGKNWNTAWCPSNPEVKPFITDIINETIDVFSPSAFNMNFDEVYLGPFHSCDRCRQKDPAELLYNSVMMIYHILAARHVKMMIAQDTLLPFPNKYAVEDKAPGWKIVSRLPKDVQIWLWYYNTDQAELNQQLNYFEQYQLRIVGATFGAANNRLMAQTLARHQNVESMVQTYWYLARDWSNPENISPYGLSMTMALAEYGWNATPAKVLSYDPVFTMMQKWRHPFGIEKADNAVPLNLMPYFNAVVGNPDSTWPSSQHASSIKLTTQNLSANGSQYHIVGSQAPNAIVVSNKNGSGLPTSAPNITINRFVKALSFVHACGTPDNYQDLDRASGKKRTPLMGQYVIQYTDGSEITFPLRYRLEIMDWNAIVSPINGQTVLQGIGDDGARYQFTATQWTNPHPEKCVSSIRLEPAKQNATSIALLALSAVPNASLKTVSIGESGAWEMTSQNFSGKAQMVSQTNNSLKIALPTTGKKALGRINITRPISVPVDKSYSLKFKLKIDTSPRTFGIYFMDKSGKNYLVHYLHPTPGEQVIQVDPAKGRQERGSITLKDVSKLQLTFWTLAGTPAQTIEIDDIQWDTQPIERKVNQLRSWWESNWQDH